MASPVMQTLQPIWRTFLSGFVALLPLVATIWIIVWLGSAAESFFGRAIRVILPDWIYFPGLGILVAIGFVFAVGVIMKQWAISRLLQFGEDLIGRIPVVKTFYTGVRDILNFVARTGKRSDLQSVVLVEVQPSRWLLGFLTNDAAAETLPELCPHEDDDHDLVAVYLPMSYQIGGYTLYLPRARVQPIDMSVEDAMRVILTAGVNRPARGTE